MRMVGTVYQDNGGGALATVAASMGAILIMAMVVTNAAGLLPDDLAGQQAADRAALTSAMWTARSLNIVSLLNVVMAILFAVIIMMDGLLFTAAITALTAILGIILCAYTGCIDKAIKQTEFVVTLGIELAEGELAKKTEPLWKGLEAVTSAEQGVLAIAPLAAIAAGAEAGARHGADLAVVVPGSLLLEQDGENRWFPATQVGVDFTSLCNPMWAGANGGYEGDWALNIVDEWQKKPKTDRPISEAFAEMYSGRFGNLDMPEAYGPISDWAHWVPFLSFWTAKAPLIGAPIWVPLSNAIAAGVVCRDTIEGLPQGISDVPLNDAQGRDVEGIANLANTVSNPTDEKLGIPSWARTSDDEEAKVRPARLVETWVPRANFLAVAWTAPNNRQRIFDYGPFDHGTDRLPQVWLARSEVVNACEANLFSPQWEARLAPLARFDEDGQVDFSKAVDQTEGETGQSMALPQELSQITQEGIQWLFTH